MIRVLNSSNINKSWVFDTGDGTENNPYYWEYVCDESKTGVSGTVSPTNNQYYKVLLKSGTTYTFRYNKYGTWDGDMRISLKDSDGNWVRQDWDSDPSEQFDRQQLKISKDFHEIKYIIEKYNIKNTSEDEMKIIKVLNIL